MSYNAAQIQSALAQLSPTDLAQVRARADLLLGEQPEAENREVSDLELVHDQLSVVLRDYGSTKDMPFAVISKMKHAKAFREGSQTLLTYSRKHLKPKDKAELVRAVRVLLGVMARNIQRKGRWPVSHRSLSYAMGHVNEVVDRKFPGYRASGLLPMIIRAQSV